jgi:5-methylcytosine-specific restriction endonuclease McrA/DNA-directed RNA polymerase subunit M/transcription elongation factor TFIIS
MSKILNLPTATIIHLYTVEHKPSTIIAKMFGVCDGVILRLLRNNNVVIDKSAAHTTRINNNELIRLYTIDNLPSTEIARHFGITFPTVLRKLRENDIPIKPKHGNPFAKTRIKLNELPTLIKEPLIINQKITGKITCPNCGKTRRLYSLTRPRIKEVLKVNGRCNKCAMKARAIPLDIQQIKHLYEVNHLTTNKIADKLKVSHHVILKTMRNNDICVRTKGETRMIRYKDKINNKGTIETPVIGDIRKGTEIGLHNVSYYMYVKCNKCGELRWEAKSRINQHPICKPCAMILNGINHQGDKSYTWQGGISFEPYDSKFNNHLREQIRQRDNYTCQLCGIPQNGRRLAVHHIDYNKKNSHPNNLISLCPSPSKCHGKTNHNREYWTQYFNNLLEERGVLIPIPQKVTAYP